MEEMTKKLINARNAESLLSITSALFGKIERTASIVYIV